jgi:hypothetical protein
LIFFQKTIAEALFCVFTAVLNDLAKFFLVEESKARTEAQNEPQEAFLYS